MAPYTHDPMLQSTEPTDTLSFSVSPSDGSTAAELQSMPDRDTEDMKWDVDDCLDMEASEHSSSCIDIEGEFTKH